ncbi:Histone deacetylase domain-containing protein [Caenorhabditis elegans]|uniref:Histone deacetylase domain-containing protein n=1 Tax=Caenorhabditis elegans TaxID=6239 RepID=Q9U266_CAEEL|nr:Histone deacetylase domain-containing protein [Caenorhabditis elegans]CAA21669.2 Histone deacetylase domain-containing protein [Caenorhabditis elegans]|eukprot:NP_496910.1 Histone deacetylase [Caenorhabditis elegans]
MAAEKKVFVIFDHQEQRHDQPWPSYHIEVPRRLDAILERLNTTKLLTDPRIEHIPRREAEESEILAVHTKRYVDDVKSTETMTVEQQESFCTKYEDIYVNSATWHRAKLAAGASIDLMTSVMAAKRPGIAFIRPPGHHAMPDEGCGFCIFNNVAIAAKAAIQNGQKVLIVDYDVHAGNGTQECVEQMGEGNVQLISIHRYENGHFWPNMPQTGIYHNYKNTINLPLNTIGLTDADYHALFTHIILPTIHAFQPDLLLVSSGFDASIGDPEGSMQVTPAGFATMIRMLIDTGIPVAALLEGGYFLDALAADSEWVLRALLGEEIPRIRVEKIHSAIADTIGRVVKRYEGSCPFFKKVQELRGILGCRVAEEDQQEEATDYTGERTVHPPYETRGIYTPFTEQKVAEFKDQLESILASYTTPPDFSAETEAFHSAIAPHSSEINDFYFGVHEDKILLGTSPAVRLFFELLFTAPYDPKHTIKLYGKVKPEDFGKIELDSRSLGEMKNISIFNNLPIFQL